MIVVTNGESTGYTPFFPGDRFKGRKYQARDLASGMRNAPSRIIFQIALSCVCAMYRRNISVFNMISMATLIYVSITILSTKHIPVDSASGKWSYSLAPTLLWLDHFSRYTMIFVVLIITNVYGSLGSSFATIPALLAVFVALIGLFPIYSWLKYVRYNRP